MNHHPQCVFVVIVSSVLALWSSAAAAQEVPVAEPDAGGPALDSPRGKLRRGVDLDLDFSSAQPIHSPVTKGSGVGFDARAGYRFADGPIFFAPGIDVGYVDFPNFDGAIRGGIGGRLGLDAGILEPSIYGYGGGFLNVWKSGYGVRTGAALDLRAGRWLVPGIHVDYDAGRWSDNGLRYVGLGAHLGLVL